MTGGRATDLKPKSVALPFFTVDYSKEVQKYWSATEYSETDIFLQHGQPVEKDQETDDNQEYASDDFEEADIFFETVEEGEEAVNGQGGEKEGNSKTKRVGEEKDNTAVDGAFCGSNHED